MARDPRAWRVVPCTCKAASQWIAVWHRHLPETNGGLFAAGLMDPDGVVWAVAMAHNPARVWQGTGRVVIGARLLAKRAGLAFEWP